MMNYKNLITAAVALSTALLFGCSTNQSAHHMVASAHLNPTQGNQVHGTVTFTQMKNGVQVVADISGLKPGSHGFHVHEKGDCSAPDGSSAGGHFNPEGMQHGGPDMADRHVGDLGNLVADESGHARMSRLDHHLALSGKDSILARAVIVHEKTDDLKSQPSGNAGSRVACGVISMGK